MREDYGVMMMIIIIIDSDDYTTVKTAKRVGRMKQRTKYTSFVAPRHNVFVVRTVKVDPFDGTNVAVTADKKAKPERIIIDRLLSIENNDDSETTEVNDGNG